MSLDLVVDSVGVYLFLVIVNIYRGRDHMTFGLLRTK